MEGAPAVEAPLVEAHRVEIYFSRWTGLEVFTIDGAVRLRERNFAFSSVRRFEIEGATTHVLEIATKAFPWPSGHVSLDGRPIIDDLFPSERRVGMTLCAVLLVLVAIAVGLAYLGWKLGRRPPWSSVPACAASCLRGTFRSVPHGLRQQEHDARDRGRLVHRAAEAERQRIEQLRRAVAGAVIPQGIDALAGVLNAHLVG